MIGIACSVKTHCLRHCSTGRSLGAGWSHGAHWSAMHFCAAHAHLAFVQKLPQQLLFSHCTLFCVLCLVRHTRGVCLIVCRAGQRQWVDAGRGFGTPGWVPLGWASPPTELAWGHGPARGPPTLGLLGGALPCWLGRPPGGPSGGPPSLLGRPAGPSALAGAAGLAPGAAGFHRTLPGLGPHGVPRAYDPPGLYAPGLYAPGARLGSFATAAGLAGLGGPAAGAWRGGSWRGLPDRGSPQHGRQQLQQPGGGGGGGAGTRGEALGGQRPGPNANPALDPDELWMPAFLSELWPEGRAGGAGAAGAAAAAVAGGGGGRASAVGGAQGGLPASGKGALATEPLSQPPLLGGAAGGKAGSVGSDGSDNERQLQL